MNDVEGDGAMEKGNTTGQVRRMMNANQAGTALQLPVFFLSL